MVDASWSVPPLNEWHQVEDRKVVLPRYEPVLRFRYAWNSQSHLRSSLAPALKGSGSAKVGRGADSATSASAGLLAALLLPPCLAMRIDGCLIPPALPSALHDWYSSACSCVSPFGLLSMHSRGGVSVGAVNVRILCWSSAASTPTGLQAGLCPRAPGHSEHMRQGTLLPAPPYRFCQLLSMPVRRH